MSLPPNAIQCTGPLFYELNHWLAPNGDFFIVSLKGNIRKLKLSNKGYYNWKNAGQLNADNTVSPMPRINDVCRNGQVSIYALVCYYFVEKITLPITVIAKLIDSSKPISASNIQWSRKGASPQIQPPASAKPKPPKPSTNTKPTSPFGFGYHKPSFTNPNSFGYQKPPSTNPNSFRFGFGYQKLPPRIPKVFKSSVIDLSTPEKFNKATSEWAKKKSLREIILGVMRFIEPTLLANREHSSLDTPEIQEIINSISKSDESVHKAYKSLLRIFHPDILIRRKDLTEFDRFKYTTIAKILTNAKSG